ncbi:unnamed protein product, partial [Adineta steineri]
MSYQKVRFKGVVKEFVTELVEGVEYLFLDDVQDKFPEVTSFSLGLQPAAFLRGKGGGARLTPLRIKAFPNEIIDAEAPQKEVFKSTVPKADNGVWTTFHETLDEMRKFVDNMKSADASGEYKDWVPVENPDLRQLETFLKRNDSRSTFGILYPYTMDVGN